MIGLLFIIVILLVVLGSLFKMFFQDLVEQRATQLYALADVEAQKKLTAYNIEAQRKFVDACRQTDADMDKKITDKYHGIETWTSQRLKELEADAKKKVIDRCTELTSETKDKILHIEADVEKQLKERKQLAEAEAEKRFKASEKEMQQKLALQEAEEKSKQQHLEKCNQMAKEIEDNVYAKAYELVAKRIAASCVPTEVSTPPPPPVPPTPALVIINTPVCSSPPPPLPVLKISVTPPSPVPSLPSPNVFTEPDRPKSPYSPPAELKRVNTPVASSSIGTGIKTSSYHPSKCPHCDVYPRNATELHKHLKEHSRKRKEPDYKDKDTDDDDEEEEDIEEETQRKCNYCKITMDASILHQHLREKHPTKERRIPPPNTDRVPCSNCTNLYPRQSIKQHERACRRDNKTGDKNFDWAVIRKLQKACKHPSSKKNKIKEAPSPPKRPKKQIPQVSCVHCHQLIAVNGISQHEPACKKKMEERGEEEEVEVEHPRKPGDPIICKYCKYACNPNGFWKHEHTCRLKHEEGTRKAENDKYQKCDTCPATIRTENMEQHILNCKGNKQDDPDAWARETESKIQDIRPPADGKNESADQTNIAHQCLYCPQTVAENERQNHYDTIHDIPKNVNTLSLGVCLVCSKRICPGFMHVHWNACTQGAIDTWSRYAECDYCTARVACFNMRHHLNYNCEEALKKGWVYAPTEQERKEKELADENDADHLDREIEDSEYVQEEDEGDEEGDIH